MIHFGIKVLKMFQSTIHQMFRSKMSHARRDSNRWLLRHGEDIGGAVLSIGSGNDTDGTGMQYRDYFPQASSYTTSEIIPDLAADLVLDVRSMPEITNDSYDCVLCSGVLEHVDNYQQGMSEITRILKSGGILLIGLPFRQAIHMSPNDFWRFTEHGIRYLLSASYEIIELTVIDDVSVGNFPAAYWVKAQKRL